MEDMINKIINKMFNENWNGESTTKDLESMKKQLNKNLNDQTEGYWSGSKAYYIMTKGGFLIDGKNSTKKKLTELGKIFMNNYKRDYHKSKGVYLND